MLLALVHGMVDPLLCYDPWAYHLPFAARLWDIGQTVQYTSSSPRFEGFGLAANWFQGLFWVVFGSVNFVALTNFIPFGLMLFLAHRWLGASAVFLAFSLLAMPLISIHLTSGYIDLFVGSTQAICFISAIRLISLLRANADIPGNGLPVTLAVFSLSAVLSANAKFQSVLVIVPMVIYFLFVAMPIRSSRRNLFILLCLLVIPGASATNIKNVISHSNPFYPYEVSLASDSFWLNGVEKFDESLMGGTTTSLWKRPYYFIASVTELDYLIQPMPEGSVYSEASQSSSLREIAKNKRLGGFFGVLIWLHLFFIALGLYKLKTGGGIPDIVRDTLNVLIALSFIFMWLPFGYELRFALVWPIMLSIVSAVIATQGVQRYWPIVTKCLPWFALLALLFVQSVVPLQRTLWPDKMISYYPQDVMKKLDPVILDAFRKHELPCFFHIKQPYDYDHFKSCNASVYAYSPAFTREAYPFHFRISGDGCQPQ